MKHVIIGNGVAGTTAALHIRKNEPAAEILILTDEAYPFYSRIRLIDILDSEASAGDLAIRKEVWYKDNAIDLRLNAEVSQIEPRSKVVRLSSGEQIPYDRLLLANGANSFLPPIPGIDRQGIFTLRNMKDAVSIRDHALSSNRKAVLIGGGVLGLEAGNSLRKAGCEIRVIEFFPRLLPRQMDPAGAEILRSQFEHKGFTFHLGAQVREIVGRTNVEGVRLDNGELLNAGLVLVSAGVRPEISLAQKAGVKTERGIVVNDRMETSMPDVYAAGDAAQHNGACYGIWPAAEKQGEVAGINMAGGSAEYRGTMMSNTLKVAGIDLYSAGDIDPDNLHESIVQSDPGAFIYRKLVIAENRVIGAILYGNVRGRKQIAAAIEAKRDISSIREELEKWDLSGL